MSSRPFWTAVCSALNVAAQPWIPMAARGGGRGGGSGRGRRGGHSGAVVEAPGVALANVAVITTAMCQGLAAVLSTPRTGPLLVGPSAMRPSSVMALEPLRVFWTTGMRIFARCRRTLTNVFILKPSGRSLILVRGARFLSILGWYSSQAPEYWDCVCSGERCLYCCVHYFQP